MHKPTTETPEHLRKPPQGGSGTAQPKPTVMEQLQALLLAEPGAYAVMDSNLTGDPDEDLGATLRWTCTLMFLDSNAKDIEGTGLTLADAVRRAIEDCAKRKGQ